MCCWIFRNAFYPAPPKKSEQIRESLKPRITHNSRQIQMTPYRLHGAPRPPRFPHRPGQNNLRIHQSFHKLIQFVKDLEIFDHAKRFDLWYTLTIPHKSSQTGPCLTTKTNELISTSDQLPPSKFAAHSLHSIVFSGFYDMRIKWMPAAAIQKANADTNPDHHHAP